MTNIIAPDEMSNEDRGDMEAEFESLRESQPLNEEEMQQIGEEYESEIAYSVQLGKILAESLNVFVQKKTK